MSDNLIERLKQLRELHSSGILTDAEFESKKAEILALAPLGLIKDPIERLKQLRELHSSGILTDAEFESKKAEILALAPLGLIKDPIERLKQLGELHSSGILTDAEFESKKAEILTLAPLGLVAEQPSRDSEAKHDDEPAKPKEKAPPTTDYVLEADTVLEAEHHDEPAEPKEKKEPSTRDAVLGCIMVTVIAAIIVVVVVAIIPKGSRETVTSPEPSPASEPTATESVYLGHCSPGPCLSLGYASPGPNNGTWVAVEWAETESDDEWMMEQVKLCIERETGLYRVTATAFNAGGGADAWFVRDDGSGPPFTWRRGEWAEEKLDELGIAQVNASGGDGGQPARTPLAGGAFDLGPGCYYLVAESGGGEVVAVLQRLEY